MPQRDENTLCGRLSVIAGEDKLTCMFCIYTKRPMSFSRSPGSMSMTGISTIV